ncbi:hypothetical protein [Pseudalkalibacillus sp. SCS-8]|uniref:hypothetical protein n=1 Tax=Pseudalkalibacillus nanhaiensis TaxID=3115291 RepID=UPI0032DA491E
MGIFYSKTFLILFSALLLFIVNRCNPLGSNPSLEDKIKSEINNPSVKVLYEDPIDRIVVFSAETQKKQSAIIINKYISKNGKLSYSSNKARAKVIDPEKKYAFVSFFNRSNTSNHRENILWGFVLNSPDADKVKYQLMSSDGEVIQSGVEAVQENGIIYTTLPDTINLRKVYKLTYHVLDIKGEILFEDS